MVTTDNTNIYIVASTGTALEVWYHPSGGSGPGWEALHLGTGFDSAGHHNAVAIDAGGSLVFILTEMGTITSADHGASWTSTITRTGGAVNTDTYNAMHTMARGGAPFSTPGHAIDEEDAVSVFDEWTLGISSLWRQSESYARAEGAGEASYPYHRIVHHAADAILACTVGYAMYTKGNPATPVIQNLLAPGERFWDVGL
jgi:hypothetical protein